MSKQMSVTIELAKRIERSLKVPTQKKNVFVICAVLFTSTEAFKCKFCDGPPAKCNGKDVAEEECFKGGRCTTVIHSSNHTEKRCSIEGYCANMKVECHECSTDLCNSVGKAEATILVSIIAMFFITKWIF